MVIVVALALFAGKEQVLALGPGAAPQKMATRFACQFTMTRSLSLLKDKISSSGKLYLGGAGLLRFETLSPTRSILVVNKGEAWMHYPDLGVTKNFDLSRDPAMAVLSIHLLAITSGDVQAVADAYTVSERTKKSMELIPKEKSIGEIFRSIRVTFDSPDVVSRVDLQSTNGDLTTIEFKNVYIQKSLPAKLFSNPAK